MNELQLASKDPIKDIAELARASGAKVEFVPIPIAALPASPLIGTPHLIVVTDGKGGVEIKSLKPHTDEFRSKPALRDGTATTTTLDSFIDLVNRHANQGSAIFVDANWRAPKFTAVIDYHAEVNGETSSATELAESTAGEDEHARNCRHRITYAFPLSEPWGVWVANNAKAMDQAEFAAFLEDHIHEVSVPDRDNPREIGWEQTFRTKFADPTALIDLSRGLEVMVGASIKNRVRLSSGETQMVFETEHRDAEGNELTVPGLFLVAVPVFYRGEVLRIPARLRYRVVNGGIKWSYELFRPDEFVDEHVRQAVETVRALTGLPTYDGAPETR